jgi:hypothetical protein
MFGITAEEMVRLCNDPWDVRSTAYSMLTGPR